MSTPQFVTPGGPPPDYPVQLEILYPDRPLNRATTFFRLFMVIPIAIVLASIEGGLSYASSSGGSTQNTSTSVGAGVLFIGPLLMILFRQKYPLWWFNFNLELVRFSTRIGLYVALLDDRYPSTDEQQSLTLNIAYPDVPNELNRFLPLVKWFLLIPHYIVLFFLGIGAFFTVIFAWFAILFTGRYPRGAFDYVVGVTRWGTRVQAYGFLLATDQYPPFRLSA